MDNYDEFESINEIGSFESSEPKSISEASESSRDVTDNRLALLASCLRLLLACP